jgi:tetratricopeptide (TPR) repeat protein
MKLFPLNKYLAVLVICMLLISCSENQEEVSSNQEIGVINFYFQNGRYFDVLVEADTLSGEALDDPELRFIIAKTYLEIGHPDRAQEILENLQIEGHQLEDINLLIVEALYKQQKIKAARELLLSNEVQVSFATHPEAILLHAKIELAENNVEASKKLLLKLEESSSRYPEGQVWLARIDLLENRQSKAVQRVQNVLEINNKLSDAWLLLANIYFRNEEYLDAENHYLQALRLDDSKILTQQSLQIAQNIVLSKTALGNSVAGEDFYQSFLESYPKSPIYYFELARLAYSKNDLNTAEINLREVLKTSENNPRVIALLAKILIKQNKLEDAGALLQQHIVNAVGGLELIVLNAIIDLELAKHQDAIALLTGYLLEDDRFRAILTPILAYAHLQNNDLDKFSELLTSYEVENAESVKGINSTRTIYLEIGMFDEAEKFLTNLVEFYPKSNEIKVLYLSTLNDIGKNEDISEKINQWLTETSGNTTLRLISINQAIENGSYRSAIAQFNQVDAKNLSEREVNLLVTNIKNLVFKTRGQDNHKNVFKLLFNWQRLLPNNVQLKLILADIYISEGVYKKAIPLYESLIEQYPNDHVILNNLAWSYFSLGDERALSAAEQAYASNSNDAAVSDTLGWILVKEGDPEKGLGYIKEALDLDPTNNAILEHYQFAKELLNQ